jgi:hypothetical protein
MLERVSSHAVIRYLERVLCLPVDDWCSDREFPHDRAKAEFCCERAGLPVDAVKLCMLTDDVLRAMGSRTATRGRLVTKECIYIFRDGNLITLLAPEMLFYRKRKHKAPKSRRLEEV